MGPPSPALISALPPSRPGLKSADWSRRHDRSGHRPGSRAARPGAERHGRRRRRRGAAGRTGEGLLNGRSGRRSVRGGRRPPVSRWRGEKWAVPPPCTVISTSSCLPVPGSRYVQTKRSEKPVMLVDTITSSTSQRTYSVPSQEDGGVLVRGVRGIGAAVAEVPAGRARSGPTCAARRTWRGPRRGSPAFLRRFIDRRVPVPAGGRPMGRTGCSPHSRRPLRDRGGVLLRRARAAAAGGRHRGAGRPRRGLEDRGYRSFGPSQARAAAVSARTPVLRVGSTTGAKYGEWLEGTSRSRVPASKAVRKASGSAPPNSQ